MSSLLFSPPQKKKAEGPTEPQQPAKKHRGSTETTPTNSASLTTPADAPATAATPTPALGAASGDAAALKESITAQGSKVRELKTSGADKV